MKFSKIIILSTLLALLSSQSNAQTLNWKALENSKHIINAGIGWDYSISYNVGYAYQVKAKAPIVLAANFSIPSGENLLDDFKTKIGGQAVLLNKSNLKGTITLNGIFRRYENPLVRLNNFGAELKGSFGYYKPKWFVAGELGFDQATFTHFKHSETYKETIFSEVKDGWYEPVSGGNFKYGIQTGYSFKKSDITFDIGMVKTQDFKSSPLIPYYLMVGYNYRIN